MKGREEIEERLVAAFFDNAAVGLQLYDEHGRSVRSNPAFQELFASTATDAAAFEAELGGCLAIADAVRRALEGERVRLRPAWCHPPAAPGERERRRVCISATFVPIRSPAGDARFVLGHFHDEEPPSCDGDSLGERLAWAEASNRAKDDFFAVLSHELRSPLNAITMWVHLLRRGMLDAAKTAHALDVIDRAIGTQVRLINDLSDLSKINAGKLVVESCWFDLGAAATEAIELIRGEAQAKGLTLEARVQPRRMPVHGDRSRIQQIIGNLLANSMKFTPSGGRIELEVHATDHLAHIVVRDTGAGIDEKLLPHVFQRFGQTDIERSHTGLGLGLTIARHLVELHGGSISAESAGSERGATFTVTLPLGPSDQSIGADASLEE